MDNRALLICGGLHPVQDTEAMLAIAHQDPVLSQHPILHLGASEPLSCLSAHALRQAFDRAWSSRHPRATTEAPAIILWAFSAGCVGATALAQHWHRYRRPVLAIFLVDGWGVPWGGDSPLHRLSHDDFTQATSGYLGAGHASFVARPAVPHLHLWRNPEAVMGQQIMTHQPDEATPDLPDHLSAADFLCGWSRHYFQEFRTFRQLSPDRPISLS